MILGHFLLNVNEVNAFVLGCSETKEAMLIDAGAYDEAVPSFVEAHGLSLGKIFITHGHFDHVAGLEEYVERFKAEVISASTSIAGCPCTQVGHGDSVQVGNLVGKVVSTPGHTPDGLSLIFPGQIFAGDALFAGSVGGTTNPEDYEQQLDHIRKNLFCCPGHYEVHVGHGPSTTVAIESSSNPFFV